MKIEKCLITLSSFKEKKEHQPGYTLQGIKYLTGSASVKLQLPFTRQGFITEQPKQQKGMSISGYQPKLSLRVINNSFHVVDTFGTYILKPSPEAYQNLAENEHAIMTVMRRLGFDVPPFGLVPFKKEKTDADNEFAFLIKRYDRNEDDQSKIHQEQLDGAMAIEEKYGKVDDIQTISYEKVCKFLIANIDSSLAFKRDLFMRIMYAYLLGNNDLHLRNFGVLTPDKEKNSLAPIYDYVSTAPYPDTFRTCFMALPLLETEEHAGDLAPGFNTAQGQYIGYDFIEFAKGIGLNDKTAIKLISLADKKGDLVRDTIKESFMPEKHKAEIIKCFNQRLSCLKVTDFSPI
jgi:serine/threonine-protein kinase HipA